MAISFSNKSFTYDKLNRQTTGLSYPANDNLQAVATDHLGSIVAEYTPQKGGTEFFGYDAWGRRYRKDGPSNLYYFDEHLSESSIPNFFNDFYSRGYTGHEHLDAFGLINMNGRLYDPIVGRMLSPDPYVPDGGYIWHLSPTLKSIYHDKKSLHHNRRHLLPKDR